MDTNTKDTSEALHPVAVPLAPKNDHLDIDSACDRMDRRREVLRKRFGEMDISAEIMQEIREP